LKEGKSMPNIKSVSALESYTSIVDELDKQKCFHILWRN